jgi:hypothetical protein
MLCHELIDESSKYLQLKHFNEVKGEIVNSTFHLTCYSVYKLILIQRKNKSRILDNLMKVDLPNIQVRLSDELIDPKNNSLNQYTFKFFGELFLNRSMMVYSIQKESHGNLSEINIRYETLSFKFNGSPISASKWIPSTKYNLVDQSKDRYYILGSKRSVALLLQDQYAYVIFGKDLVQKVQNDYFTDTQEVVISV